MKLICFLGQTGSVHEKNLIALGINFVTYRYLKNVVDRVNDVRKPEHLDH